MDNAFRNTINLVAKWHENEKEAALGWRSVTKMAHKPDSNTQFLTGEIGRLHKTFLFIYFLLY